MKVDAFKGCCVRDERHLHTAATLLPTLVHVFALVWRFLSFIFTMSWLLGALGTSLASNLGRGRKLRNCLWKTARKQKSALLAVDRWIKANVIFLGFSLIRGMETFKYVISHIARLTFSILLKLAQSARTNFLFFLFLLFFS